MHEARGKQMDTTLAPEKCGRSADRVYDQLKLMAVTYQFRPGERINEVDLSRQLSISRTPVREALNRLAAEGFLTSVTNRGFFGRKLDAKEILDLYEHRCLLEQAIVRLACERASDDELEELVRFVEGSQADPAQQPLEVLRDDEEFHLRIARLTRNAELVRSLSAINSRIHFVRWIDLRTRARSKDAHLRLAHLLRQRDQERAAEQVGGMIRRRYEQIVEVIRAGIAEIYLAPETELRSIAI